MKLNEILDVLKEDCKDIESINSSGSIVFGASVKASEKKAVIERFQKLLPLLNTETYKEKRAREYPSVGDQLDAIWKALATIDLPEQSKVMLDAINSVKTKFPKG